ncbi:MAG: hypothetical protein K1X95_05895 [Acidimicrobiia bacterium]|nr:hypothetical protein [Acidimicrobiia bacterium]
MRIDTDATIHHRRDVAYRAVRDNLVEVGEHLPNITEIELVERSEPEAGVVEFVNIWHGEGSIPSVARPFIKSSMLRWTDYARWDESDWSCTWRLETAFMTERVTCSGRNTYEVVDDDHTRLHITGDLAIDLTRFPGVPSLVTRRAQPTVEKFIVGLITPNLTKTAEAVDAYLDSEARRGKGP